MADTRHPGRRHAGRHGRRLQYGDTLGQRQRHRLYGGFRHPHARLRSLAEPHDIDKRRRRGGAQQGRLYRNPDAPLPEPQLLCEGATGNQRGPDRRIGRLLLRHSRSRRDGDGWQSRSLADLLHIGRQELDEGYLGGSGRHRLEELHRRQPHPPPRADADRRLCRRHAAQRRQTRVRRLGRPGLLARERRTVDLCGPRLPRPVEDLQVPHNDRRQRASGHRRSCHRRNDRADQRHRQRRHRQHVRRLHPLLHGMASD